MFDRVSDSFNGVFKKLSGNATITESNVKEAMDEVRNALLEADVHYEVAEAFCAKVLEDAKGEQVTKSLKPGQEMIGIVHRRLIELFGGDPNAKEQPAPPGILKMSPGPTVIMMCGLQGSGKTTTCGKLAGMLKKQGRSVMLAAADLQRPAAIDQLETVAKQANEELPGGSQVHFYGEHDKTAEYGKAVGVAIKVCQHALKEAKAKGVDVLILDTAGRLHVNDELMHELKGVRSMLQPHHIFLVVDAMTGQDAVNSAKAFHEQLAVDGVILTKFDSDTRGGAALSVKQVTGAPIRYIGVGEKLDAIEPFHPERMAGRILGMGDVVSLVEKAQEEVSEEEAAALEAKMAKGELDMDDFLKQMKMMRRMGSMKSLLGMLPGVGSAIKGMDIDEKQLDRTEAMIQSMTRDERKRPDIIRHSRKQRIASGSGTNPNQVGQLAKQFGMLSKVMKQMGAMGAGGKAAAAKAMGGALGGGGMPGMGGMGVPGFSMKKSTKSKSIKKRKKRR
ncbi:MAG: signal recognition particle protein [Phycisphaerae bacterium]|nr:signal recognition particle protein [Phycisphaerae bacterium]MBM91226.1 signal recognition particle protein [Phycisphaerae bacterium]